MDWRYQLDKRATFAGLRTAKLLPRWLVRWAYIRVLADVSTGPLSSMAMPDIGAVQALQVWED